MSLFSKQEYVCCMCSTKTERTVNEGAFFKEGVCGMRCLKEKQWRETLSIMNSPYKPDPREFDERGYEVKK